MPGVVLLYQIEVWGRNRDGVKLYLYPYIRLILSTYICRNNILYTLHDLIHVYKDNEAILRSWDTVKGAVHPISQMLIVVL